MNGESTTRTNEARTRCESLSRSRILKHSRCWSILQNETGMRCSWRNHCAVLQMIYQTKIDIKVSSPLHDTAWIRISCGLTPNGHANRQNSHQRLKERIRIIGGTAVAQALGDLLPFILKSHRHHQPTDCTQARPDFAWPGIGGPNAFQSPSVHGKDTSQPRKIHMGERP